MAWLLFEGNTLKFHPVGDVAHIHGIVLSKYHLLPETLNPMIKIPRRKQYIPPHDRVPGLLHMILEELLPRHLQRFAFNLHLDSDILLSLVSHLVDDCSIHLLKLWCEV